MTTARSVARPARAKREVVKAKREIGYVQGLGTDWEQWDAFEKVPDLQWPRAIEIYSRMSREDGRVSSVLQANNLPIVRTPWRIDQDGASDEVTEFVATNMGLPIRGEDPTEPTKRSRNHFSWTQHLLLALAKNVYGHAFFEQVYRAVGEGRKTRLHLQKLAPRPQSTIMRINVALDGGLESIEQFSPSVMGYRQGVQTANTTSYIPVSQLVAYVRDPEPGLWLGRSILRPAYKNWVLKDELLRIQAAAARRNGMGVPVATAPEGVTDDDEIAYYQEVAQDYQGGMDAGVGLPFGSTLKLLGVQGNLPDLQLAIEYHDRQIALAALAHVLNLDGKGGSYALATVQNDIFTQAVQSDAESIRDTAQAHIIEDLVDINFGPDEPTPLLTFDEIGSRQDATAAALGLLVKAGILAPDPALEAFERQQLGLPAADPDDDPEPEPTPPPAPAPTDPPAPDNRSRERRRRNRVTVHPNGALTLF